MSETKPKTRQYKSRKTPASPYPPVPPRIPEQIESLYLAINHKALDLAIAPFGESIVTSHILYKPGILALARVTFEGTRWEIFHERDVIRVINFPGQMQFADWEKHLIEKWDSSNIRSDAEGLAFYGVEPGFDFSRDNFEALQEQFTDYLLAQTLELSYNPHLRIYRKLDEDEPQFFQRCLESVRELYDHEKKTLKETILRHEERLKEKLEREMREHGGNTAELQSFNPDDTKPGTSKASRSPSKNQAEMDAKESIVNIEDIQRELAIIQKDKEEKLNEFEENLHSLASQRETDLIRVNRGNIKVSRFSLLWLPYTEFIIQEDDRRRVELVRSF